MRKNNFAFQVIFFGVFLLLGALIFGCAKKEIKNISSQGKTIICFGDSLTCGYGVEKSEAYPALLSKMLGLSVENSGISGNTSTQGLERIESDVLNKNPLLVIVEFGGNDFINQVPKEKTVQNILAMVDRIHAQGAFVAIVDTSAGMLMKEYQPLFYRIARYKNAIFISDVFKGIITNPALKSDFFHPNPQGYQLVAQRIYQAIVPHLKQNSILRLDKNKAG